LSQTLDAPLSKLFPSLFSIPRPITTPDIPVIMAASILSTYEFPILPITKAGAPQEVEKKGIKLFKAIGGQQIIRLVLESKPSEYYKILWSPCTKATMWLGALEYRDSFEKLLRTFEVTGFGDARVNARAPPHALVTLEEVVSLYRERKLKCKLEVNEVASRIVFADPDTRLVEAMRTMVDKRIRRLFLRGEEGVFVSDRNILAFLFSPKALAVARRAPDLWTDESLSSLPSTKASVVSPQAKVEEVGSKLGAGREVSVLSDGASLVSRWDLVMKPWKKGQLRLAN
jgi:CBS domain-containing protein